MAIQVTIWKAADGSMHKTEQEALASEARNRAERKKLDQRRNLTRIRGIGKEVAIIIQDSYPEIKAIMER